MAVQLEAKAQSWGLELVLNLARDGRVLNDIERDNGGSAGSKCDVGCVVNAFELQGNVHVEERTFRIEPGRQRDRADFGIGFSQKPCRAI